MILKIIRHSQKYYSTICQYAQEVNYRLLKYEQANFLQSLLDHRKCL